MIEVRKISEEEISQKQIKSWPVWEKGTSRFRHTYEEEEWCYFLEGTVLIMTEAGDYYIEPGDFVVFKTGLKCTWEIHEPVRKHYKFL